MNPKEHPTKYLCLECVLNFYLSDGKTVLVRKRSLTDDSKLGLCLQCTKRPATHELEVKREAPPNVIRLPKD